MNAAAVDTNPRKMPDPLPFAGWRALGPAGAAAEFARRLAALPVDLRRSALAWRRPPDALADELAAAVAARRPLGGLPYLAKDLFDVAGAPTHAGSAFLARVRPVAGDSALVARMRELGAGLAGKTHLVEFAAGLTGENRTYGDCPHPHAAGRLAGGSSSGSAALVAAGLVPCALGTDTGGSVRVPAAFCGLYGYRGVPGAPFIRDAFPLSPTCDTAGWFTAHADDMRELLGLLAPGEPGTRPDVTPRGAFVRASDLWPDTAAAFDDALADAAACLAPEASAELAASVCHAWMGVVDAYGTVVMSEAHTIHRKWLEPHRADYDPAIWQRLHDAAALSAEQIDMGHTMVAWVRESFAWLWSEVDFLLLPAAPRPAPTKAECTPETRRGILTCTAPASLAGLPCLTLPVRLGGGLSGGWQLLAREPAGEIFDWALRRWAVSADEG